MHALYTTKENQFWSCYIDPRVASSAQRPYPGGRLPAITCSCQPSTLERQCTSCCYNSATARMRLLISPLPTQTTTASPANYNFPLRGGRRMPKLIMILQAFPQYEKICIIKRFRGCGCSSLRLIVYTLYVRHI